MARPSGRPNLTIDWEKVGQWIMGGAKAVEVAASLGCSPDTLYTRCKKDLQQDFTAFCQEKRSAGDRILHNTQFEVAVKNKNTSMLIWLGKQRLGQKDKDEEITVTPETLNAFSAFMDMLNKAQSSDLNKDDTSKSTESKS